jgi:ABC-2 type transport system permease protein
VASFAALALLLAGTLRPEATLAAANLIWLLLLAFGATVIPVERYPAAVQPIMELLPSAALATALTDGLTGTWPAAELLVMAVWGGIAALIAARTFRWN